jgi:hypothetical protein
LVLNRLDFSRIRAQAAGETIDDLSELSRTRSIQEVDAAHASHCSATP